MKPRLWAVLAALLIQACSLDYGEDNQGQVGKTVPNSVLINMKQTTVKNDKVRFQITSNLAEFFDSRQESQLEKLNFQELDDQGKALTDGQADSAVIRTDTNDATATGGITIYSARESTKFFADSLTWVNNDRILKSQETSPVTLERDSGTSLEGKGFEMNFKTGVMVFTQGVRGTVVEKKDTEEKK